MHETWFCCCNDVVTLTLHVQPGAKRTEVVGLHGAALKIKLAAAPEEGRANAALLRYFADHFDVPLRQVELMQGAQSRHKVIAIRATHIDPLSLLPKPLKKPT